ncbi:hypothetical protein [Roseococcus sp. YIM B11640]|uniref:hypothetical protein n=1 Tax=Roseococcus sp. YIM B11640 TaxID=3133973 RepID=UPI003C7E0382
MALLLEHRPAPPWISAKAVTFRSEIASTGLMVALPCYGGMLSAATLRGLLDTQRACLALGLPLVVATLTNESLVTRGRNRLLGQFLRSDASHLLFVDSDIGFGADGVLRLLGHGLPFIGGLYRSKNGARADWVAQFPASGQVRHDPRTGAVEAEAVGTGFLLLHRSVPERLAEAHPAALYQGEEGPLHALFEAGIDPSAAPGQGRYLSEDYLFCARWRALGGKVWCDPAVVLEHHGQVAVAGDAMGLFAPG